MFRMIFYFFLVVFLNFSEIHSRDFIDKGVYVIDLKSRVEWLKCSAGQQWDEISCSGKAVMLSMEEAENIKSQVGDELGGEWRLPNKEELTSLICKECEGAKIDKNIFPNTPAGLFWTSQRNWWSPKFFWSVNFFTGHPYGRFVPEKKLFIRFLRDR